MKKFIIGALYAGLPDESDYILRFERFYSTDIPLFTPLTKVIFTPCVDGLIGIGCAGPEDFRRAWLWSDLLTPADRKKAVGMIDPLNGRFEDEVLRHLAARRARLRKLTPVLGGEYYAR